jgi:hypothetical protein
MKRSLQRFGFQDKNMSKLHLWNIMLMLTVGSLPARPCSCQKALEHDLPHGANEDIEYSEKTVKRIQGRVVYFHDASPADDVVVEVYQITREDKKLRPREIVLRRVRRAACVTQKDGSFCFADLPSGRYVVRAGTRSASAGMNEVFLRVNLDRRWWSRWFRTGKNIQLELTPGT